MREELEAYGAALTTKTEIVALSKCDALDEDTLSSRLAELGQASDSKPIALSSTSNKGVREALFGLANIIEKVQTEQRELELAEAEPQTWRP